MLRPAKGGDDVFESEGGKDNRRWSHHLLFFNSGVWGPFALCWPPLLLQQQPLEAWLIGWFITASRTASLVSNCAPGRTTDGHHLLWGNIFYWPIIWDTHVECTNLKYRPWLLQSILEFSIKSRPAVEWITEKKALQSSFYTKLLVPVGHN